MLPGGSAVPLPTGVGVGLLMSWGWSASGESGRGSPGSWGCVVLLIVGALEVACCPHSGVPEAAAREPPRRGLFGPDAVH